MYLIDILHLCYSGISRDIPNQVEYFVVNKSQFPRFHPKGPHRLENRNADMFGMPSESMYDEAAIHKYIESKYLIYEASKFLI